MKVWVSLMLTLGICGCRSADDVPSDVAQDDTTATDSEGSPSLPPGQVHALSDGTTVVVGDDGRITVHRGDRTVFATAAGHAPTLLSYDLSWQGGLGLWTFARNGESEQALTQRAEVRTTPERVEIDLQAPSGAAASIVVAVHRPGDAVRVQITPEGGGVRGIGVPLACGPNATFLGFGERYGPTDARGQAFSLMVTEQGIGRDPALGPLPFNGDAHTTYFPMPWWLDSRGGTGTLLRTDHNVHVDLCARDPEVAWFETSEPAADIIVTFGPTPADVLRQLGDEVGRPSQPPAWAWQPWLASQGGREALEDEVAALRAADVPVGAIWAQDWTGIRMNLDGGFGVEYRWVADETLYPDLAGMIDQLHDQGIRFLGYANPFIDPTLDHYEAMAQDGLLVDDEAGEPYLFFAPNGMSALPDFTNPEAEAYTQQFMRAMVEDYGMDGWMSDFGEWLQLDSVLADGSDPLAYHNRFPVDWHRQWREVMNEVRPDGDFAVFARSGWTGVHEHAQIYWVGDQEATWSVHDGLPTVVPALVSLGLSGIPYATLDVAGFSGGPSTRELFCRWAELGAFTPILRTHDGNLKTENWAWDHDPVTTQLFRRLARIHVALIPQLQTWAAEGAVSGLPMVRHPMLEFPDDPGSHAVEDAFMLGDAFYVAPVVIQGATTKTLYLPPGEWFHLWTGDAYVGPDTIEVDAPLGQPPVFTRDLDREDLRAIE